MHTQPYLYLSDILSLYPSFYPICLSTYPSFYLPLSVSIYLTSYNAYLKLSLSRCRASYTSGQLSLSLHTHMCLYVYMSTYIHHIYPSLSLSILSYHAFLSVYRFLSRWQSNSNPFQTLFSNRFQIFSNLHLKLSLSRCRASYTSGYLSRISSRLMPERDSKDSK